MKNVDLYLHFFQPVSIIHGKYSRSYYRALFCLQRSVCLCVRDSESVHQHSIPSADKADRTDSHLAPACWVSTFSRSYFKVASCQSCHERKKERSERCFCPFSGAASCRCTSTTMSSWLTVRFCSRLSHLLSKGLKAMSMNSRSWTFPACKCIQVSYPIDYGS